MARPPDPIEVLEAAYNLEIDDSAWLRGLLDTVYPLLDGERGVMAYCYDMSQPMESLFDGAVHRGVARAHLPRLHEVVSRHSDVSREMHMIPSCFTSLRLQVSKMAELGGIQAMEAMFAALDCVDVVALQTVELGGRGVLFFAPQAEVRALDTRTRRVWSRVAAHIAAARRLRQSLAAGTSTVEAVLTPSGKLEHADAIATTTARAALHEAVLRMERVRGRRNVDAETATSAWTALVHGRWSLVDRFERGGRRYLVARPNPPAISDPRALTTREHTIASLAALGKANKLIAYELGISESTVATHLGLAMRKLGVRSRPQLVATVAQLSTVGSSTFEVEAGSEELVVHSSHHVVPTHETLTAAERLIATDAAAGLSNATIAARRRRSIRTIANQLASIYRKLGVGSRSELAARLR